MKKLLLLIFLGLTALALAACGGDSGKPEAVQTEPDTASTVTAGASVDDKGEHAGFYRA